MRGTSSRIARSDGFKVLARAALVVRGVLYLLLAVIVVQIAFGNTSEEADSGGALRLLAEQPFGAFLLVAAAVGFGAYAVWQGLQAVFDPSDDADSGGTGVAQRAGYGFVALVYAGLCVSAISVMAGGSSGESVDEGAVTARIFESGWWILALVGVVVAAVGVAMAWWALRGGLTERLRGRDDATATRTIQAGYVARGAVVSLVGVLVVLAAVQSDAQEAAGLDGVLSALARQPYGRPMLVAVALAMGGFGVASCLEARARKVGDQN